MTGLGRSTIYAHMDAGIFPRPIKLGPRAVGWLQKEIEEWIELRLSERPAGSTEAKVCLSDGCV